MSNRIFKILPILIFGGIFIFVLLKVDYPNSLTSASAFQLGAFLIPIFLTLTFALNFVIGFLFISAAISLSLTIILLLNALNSLNVVTAVITIIAIYLLVNYLQKIRKNTIFHSFKSRGKLTKKL